MFNTAELRDTRGRWTASPSAVRTALADRPAEMDRIGSIGHPEARESINTQTYAQGVAAATANHISELSAEGKATSAAEKAVGLWHSYQAPSQYGLINDCLRTGKTVQGITAATMRKYVDNMYDLLGYTIPKPMTVYRAIHAGGTSGIDWSAKLKPGTIYQDKGFESSTAEPGFALGWLDLPDHADPNPFTDEGRGGRTERPDDVVLEIHLPTGTRIVGGDPGFVETMLKPGTKFKVISQERRTGKNGRNPLLEGEPAAKQKPFVYTHVVAEVQP